MKSPEEVRAYNRAWYAKNREAEYERTKAYRAANRDKVRVWSRAFYAKNREKLCDRGREWRRANPETVSAAKKRWVTQNPERQFEYRRRWRVKRDAGYAYIDSLRAGGCVDCGNKNFAVLDFDHLRDKKHLVSYMAFKPFAEIDAEAAKCEVRCSNCHRLKTIERRQQVAKVGK